MNCKCSHEMAEHSDRAIVACEGKLDPPIVRHIDTEYARYDVTSYACPCAGYGVTQ